MTTPTTGAGGRINSMAQRMMGLRVQDKTEKGLLVRIGTLIDALVTAQRGQSNAANSLSRKANVANLKKPNPLTGSTQNIFNGASVSITPTDTSGNLSHYEAQISDDPNFSAPTSKEIFTTNTTFKGLVSATTYHIRIRPITKNGQIGDWAQLDSVTTTGQTSGADFDGTFGGVNAVSKTFTFESSAQDIFNVAAGGLRTILVFPTDPKTGGPSGFNDATAAMTDISYRDRRIDIASVATVVETIDFPGVAATPSGIPTGGPDPNAHYADMNLTRYNPLIFFDLMQADPNASFPVDYTFDVQVNIANAGWVTSTNDATWVEF
jgi:hypothetical protein